MYKNQMKTLICKICNKEMIGYTQRMVENMMEKHNASNAHQKRLEIKG